MTTAELIKALQEADPEGAALVMDEHGDPVWFAERKPAFWDGPTHSLIIGTTGRAIGYRISRTGPHKLVLHSRSIEDVLFDNPEAEVDLSGLSGQYLERWTEDVNKMRAEYREGHETP